MRAITPRAEIPMNLEALPKPIRLPLSDIERVILILGGLFVAIGVFCLVFTSETIAGYAFGGLGLAAAAYSLCSFIPYSASAAKNKTILIDPIKKALQEEGYTLTTKKIMMMWSEGTGVNHGGRVFFASGRQATKFTLTVM